ncbi:C6 transcription factor [Apiospora rasikravindrae]|uniref:C6 transcription factor n=1 Tax=Apiospora rasikravindrae TaxID=990691 RepID=A0ABR1RNF6_9PEZI
METTSPTVAATSSSGTRPSFKLSCTTCRSKKIKCNRVHPCSHCTKSGIECVFPARKRMERPRKTRNQELLNRISRLESIVGKVDVQSLKDLDIDISDINLSNTPETSAPAAEASPSVTRPGISTQTPGAHHASAHPHQNESHTARRYVGGDFWLNLSHEVEGLKQALEQPSDTDSGEESETETPESSMGQQKPQPFVTQGLLVGCKSPESSGLIHPATAQILYLLSVFFDRVDPILKILHRPSILVMLPAGLPRLTLAQEALAFSIYFASITSLTPEACQINLGQDRVTLLKTYQLAVERALGAADYLTNTDLECIQALLLYVACLRVHNQSRASWALTALLLRLGQGAGLLRDGEGRGYSPFEVEMRRRIFWQIVVLDVRAAEDRGTEAMIATSMLNMRLPLNLNDDDFGPDSLGPLVERTGGSDITFALATAQSSSIFLWLGQIQSQPLGSTPPQQTEDEMITHAQRLETKYITSADLSHYQSAMAAGLIRLINLKFWLALQYPINPPAQPASSSPSYPLPVVSAPGDVALPSTGGEPSIAIQLRQQQQQRERRWPKVSREAMLQTAVSVLELTQRNEKSPFAERFGWWSNTYRAWASVDIVYPLWAHVVADTRRGQLWRPIRKLYKKAKAARAAALRQEEEETKWRQQTGFNDDVPWMAGPWMTNPGYDVGLDGNSSTKVNTPAAATPNATAIAEIGMSSAAAGSEPTIPMDTSGDSSNGLGMPAAVVPGMTGMSPTSIDLGPASRFTDPGMGWPGLNNINFDMPRDGGFDFVNWGVWNEFMSDTFAENKSRTGSSEDS